MTRAPQPTSARGIRRKLTLPAGRQPTRVLPTNRWWTGRSFGELGDGSWEIRGNDWRDEDPVAGIGWEPGLLESLRIQLKTAISCPRDQRIGEYLLGCLDNRGYLAVTVDEIAAALNVDVDEVEASTAGAAES